MGWSWVTGPKVNSLDTLSWIDWAAMTVVAVFLILGLFRGFLWQASRFVSLILAFVLAGEFAEPFSDVLATRLSGVGDSASYYLAYALIFIGTVVLLSVLTKMVERLVHKMELGFYDHVGGGLLGAATAAGLIIAALGLAYRVLPDGHFVSEARASKTHDVSRFVVERIGLPDEIQKLYMAPGLNEEDLRSVLELRRRSASLEHAMQEFRASDDGR